MIKTHYKSVVIIGNNPACKYPKVLKFSRIYNIIYAQAINKTENILYSLCLEYTY
jgi:hypothetical protein